MNERGYLLFEPAQVSHLKSPFFIIKMVNKEQNISKKIVPQAKHKKEYPFLKSLHNDTFDEKKEQLETAIHRKFDSETERQAFFDQKLLHEWHKAFKSTWDKIQDAYYRHENNGRIKVEKAYFNSSIVTFHTILQKTANGYDLEIQFNLGKWHAIPIEELIFSKFIIYYKEQFYLLNYKDYKFLIGLIEDYKNIPLNAFIDKYYKPESSKYQIEFINIFEEETVEIEPDNLLQISELGDFLVFTPKWRYNDHIIEGEKPYFEKVDGRKKRIYKRDQKKEQAFLNFIQNAHPNIEGRHPMYVTFDEAKKEHWFYNFFYKELHGDVEVLGLDMLSNFRYSDEPMDYTIEEVESKGDLTSVRLEVFFGNQNIKLETLRNAILESKSFVLLKDNSLGVLPNEWVREFGPILCWGKIEDDLISFHPWVLLSSFSAGTSAIQPKLPPDWINRWQQWLKGEQEVVAAPKLLKAQLRPYQQKGYEWMELINELGAGTLLADDMGLGKTIQGIATLCKTYQEGSIGKSIIICPSSLIYNWEKEISKFAPHLNTYIYHGANRNWDEFMNGDAQIMITSYALARNDFELIAPLHWNTLILDESHHIKNIQALTTKAVLKLQASKRILLNGTPIVNRVEDLYPQFQMLLPGFYPSESQFVKLYHTIDKNSGEKRLKQVVNTFVLRRTKAKTLKDLPPKIESNISCFMQADQRALYEEVREKIRSNVLSGISKSGISKTKLSILQGIMQLRQICSHPRNVSNKYTLAQDISSIKEQMIIEDISSSLKSEKVIIFSQFLNTLDAMKQALDKHKVSYEYFDGSTSALERNRKVERFQDPDSDIQVFLLSLMAGNTGITLTNANYVFLLDPWWNKAAMNQAIDRVHRIGQTESVFAYHLICHNTIEQRILELQEQKEILSDELIDENANFIKSLTEDDIQFLFS